ALAAAHAEVDQLRASREQIRNLNAEADALLSHLNALIRSTSWKISAPLRMVGRRLPIVARVSRKILSRMWHLGYILWGHDESAFARPPVVLPASPGHDVIELFAGFVDKADRRVVLVAADAPPMFDKHAGALRFHNLVRLLCDMDWRVVFASHCTQEFFTV